MASPEWRKGQFEDISLTFAGTVLKDLYISLTTLADRRIASFGLAVALVLLGLVVDAGAQGRPGSTPNTNFIPDAISTPIPPPSGPVILQAGGSEAATNPVQIPDVIQSAPPQNSRNSGRESEGGGSSAPKPRTQTTQRKGSGSRPATPKKPSTNLYSHYSPKSPKNPIPQEQAEPVAPTWRDWHVTGEIGWANRFQFRGLDIFDRVSAGDSNSGMFSSNLAMQKQTAKGGVWDLGGWYLQSLDPLLTQGAASRVDPNSASSRNENFAVPSRRRYEEIGFNATYSHELYQGLWGFGGVRHYRFSDGGFWENSDGPITHTTELVLGTYYRGFDKYVTPSLTWSRDVDAFDGGYLEFQLQGAGFRMPGLDRVTISPFLRTAYDFEFNGDNDGWNNFEFGAEMPIRLTDHLELVLSAAYTMDLDDPNSDGSARTDDGFFGGVSLRTKFGTGVYGPSEPGGQVSNSVAFFTTPPARGLSISMGAGYQQIDASFDHRGSPTYDALSLVRRGQGGGDLHVAGDSPASYLNGRVGASRTDGTSRFSGGETDGSLDTMGGGEFQTGRRSSTRAATPTAVRLAATIRRRVMRTKSSTHTSTSTMISGRWALATSTSVPATPTRTPRWTPGPAWSRSPPPTRR